MKIVVFLMFAVIALAFATRGFIELENVHYEGVSTISEGRAVEIIREYQKDGNFINAISGGNGSIRLIYDFNTSETIAELDGTKDATGAIVLFVFSGVTFIIAAVLLFISDGDSD